MLNVMIVDEDAGRSVILEQALVDCGYHVIAKVSPGENLVDLVNKYKPDVIIIDIQSPDRDTLEYMQIITQEDPKPIVMFADDDDSGVISSAVRAGVSAYIVDGLNKNRVKPIMDVAIARFREYQALRNELQKTRSSLEERKLVDKAKGVLMKHRGISEDEAYRELRTLAMNRNKKIADVAKDVLSIIDLLGDK
jgi:response regulator NasT